MPPAQTNLFSHFRRMVRPSQPDSSIGGQEQRQDKPEGPVRDKKHIPCRNIPKFGYCRNERTFCPFNHDRSAASSARDASNFHRKRDAPRRSPYQQAQRDALVAAAKETLDTLPTIFSDLSSFSSIDLTSASMHHTSDSAPVSMLSSLGHVCPGFTLPANDQEGGRKGTRIRVLDSDSFDAALALQPGTNASTLFPSSAISPYFTTAQPPTKTSSNSTGKSTHNQKPVLVLNLANAVHPCGGFLTGALAQEEALCYRSSLSLSLQRRHYPIPSLSALYTPHVVILRDALSQGHQLFYPNTPASDLPITSVLTLAALCRPRVTFIKNKCDTQDSQDTQSSEDWLDAEQDSQMTGTSTTAEQDSQMTGASTAPSIPPSASSKSALTGSKDNSHNKREGEPVFAHYEDVEITKYKIRLALRLSVMQGHTKIVLGALGCGAFHNPPKEIARFFAEVFAEDEFRGGWWEDVVFAVMDNVGSGKGGQQGEGNYGIFWRALDGIVV